MVSPLPTVTCEEIAGPSGTTIYVSGPSLNAGPLPALFYFALSGNASLTLDPFNQPVAFLDQTPIRTFSLTLPGHGKGMEVTEAMAFWAQNLHKDSNLLADFIDNTVDQVNYLIDKGLIDPSYIAAAGLSRGGFIAAHVTARIPAIKTLAALAPLTTLTTLREFNNIDSADELSLIHHVDALADKSIRFYIGNRDTRVSTEKCFELVSALSNAAYAKKIRSPQIELIVFPSIGHRGHGTPTDIFRDGATWIKQQITPSPR